MFYNNNYKKNITAHKSNHGMVLDLKTQYKRLTTERIS